MAMFEDIAAFKQAVGGDARLLGLDIGSKTVGLASGSVMLGVATPIETLKRTKFGQDAEKLFKRVDEEGVAGLVLGLPINMDGSEGPRVQSTRQFAKNLLKIRDIPIAFWDERLSTAAAERTLLEADTSRAKRKGVIDKMAAAIILQGALERMYYL